MKKVLSIICILLVNTFAAQGQNWFSDFHMCETKDTTIIFPPSVISDSFTWTFNDEPYTSNQDGSIFIDTASTTGEYTLEIINAGTIYTESFLVTIDMVVNNYTIYLNGELPSYSDTLCLEEVPTLNSNYPDFTHYWYLDDEALDDTLSESNLVIEDILEELDFNQEYIYTLKLENTCGFEYAKNEVTLVVNECHCALNMPDVFTPNGDEFNNTFKPYNDHENLAAEDIEIMCKSTDFRMEVFSQWGRHMATVNSGNDYPSWDGLNKRGNEVAEGVYFYRIMYKVNIYTFPIEKEITGFVHLYRD